ncbi:MAG: M13 family metallopeptidase [Clostridiales bacterium]|nr:M13 family metallopeptidase [Clostridiales bacterium]
MKKFIGTFLICSLALPVLSGCVVEAVPDETETTPSVTEPIQGAVRPRDDFYGYVNGDSLSDMEFGYGELSAGSFDQDYVVDQVKEIVLSVASGSGYETGTEEYVIKQAYDLFLSYDFESGEVPGDIDAMLHQIDDCTTVEELLALDAVLVRDYGINGIFNLSTGVDYLDSGRNILMFCQYDGIMEVSFKDLDDTYGPLNDLKTMGSAAMQAMGHDKESADEVGNEFGYMAMDIYNSTDMDACNCIMPYEYFQVMSREEIDSIFTNADITAYLSAVGYDLSYCTEFGVTDPGQLQGLNAVLTEEKLPGLKAWEMCRLIEKYRNFVAGGYESLKKYETVGYKDAEDLALDEIVQVFVAETDPLYVEQYYSEQMDAALISMCDDIREGYRDLISGADWLTEQTREGLLLKLDNIIYVTAADLERHDPYTDLCYDDYYQLIRSYAAREKQEDMEELTRPADRKSVRMPMQMVNACYDPSLNNITITRAIMNAPFFDMEADYYTNLGGLGMVIAHEMGHAFDSNCILFDENGVYDPSWIAESDVETLEARNAEAISYFEDNFTVFGVYHVDGEQTLGENYADLGGMECVTSLADNSEQLQLLFENYARIWCEKIVDTALLDQLDTDEHSPAMIRTNAVLSTLDCFYETYGVTEGDGMYIAPGDRISRWY